MDLGRTDLDLFSVHAQHGTIRSDYCGALVITARPAETIGADRIGFGNLTYYWMQVWMQVGPPPAPARHSDLGVQGVNGLIR